jgi:hypothetical protein
MDIKISTGRMDMAFFRSINTGLKGLKAILKISILIIGKNLSKMNTGDSWIRTRLIMMKSISGIEDNLQRVIVPGYRAVPVVGIWFPFGECWIRLVHSELEGLSLIGSRAHGAEIVCGTGRCPVVGI